MKKLVYGLMAATTLMACNDDHNVLLDKEYNTVAGLPPFEQIHERYYMPAFKAAIEEYRNEISLIKSQRDEPTFRNTIVPYDRVGGWLEDLSSIFFNIQSTDATDTMEVITADLLPILSRLEDEVMMDEKLFSRIKHVYDHRMEEGLDSVQLRLVELYYRDFVRSGALLNEKDKKRLSEINEKLSQLTHTMSVNVRKESNDNYKLVIDSAADLSGLPEDVIASAAERAEKAGLSGKWVFLPQAACVFPFLQYSDRHDLRKQLYEGYVKRCRQGGDNDNSQIIHDIAKLRAEKAQILGYKTYAHYSTDVKMSGNPEVVDTFLMNVWPMALNTAKKELEDMRKFARTQDKNAVVEACDWWYWTEQLRKARFDVDATKVSEYFQLETVRDAMLRIASQLYGVEFTVLEGAPKYNPENNEVWSVKQDGKDIAIVYFDWFPRSSKRGGAWTTSFRNDATPLDGSERRLPVISICCNFPQPAKGAPALLGTDEVETMFHEFGHGLHSFFARSNYNRTLRHVPHDYVELPSQINEFWAFEPSVLKTYAKHYKTGEVIPEELVEKLSQMSTFNQGFRSTEYLAASLIDMHWHSYSAGDEIPSAEKVEEEVINRIGLIPEIAPRYHSTYFTHIFSGGYAAGYYDYEWAEMLCADAFEAFRESGDVLDKGTAARFRKYCLERPGDYDALEMFTEFRGHRPDVSYLLKQRGFVVPDNKTKKR